MLTIEYFIIALYVFIDDLLKSLKLRKSGFKPKCTDSELFTIAMIQCWKKEESESAFLSEYKKFLLEFFPNLPSVKEYNRRLKENQNLLSAVWNFMLEMLMPEFSEEQDGYIDTMPMPIKKFSRKPKGNYHPEAACGYCATKKMFFWGYFLHLVVSPQGIPLHFTILSADVDETSILKKDFLNALAGYRLGGDKGYIIPKKKKVNLWQKLKITLTHPFRRNQKEQNTDEEKRFLKGRGIIERIFSWMDNRFNMERTYAKSYEGLTSRTWRKLLFLGFSMLFNSLLGKPLLQISKLWR